MMVVGNLMVNKLFFANFAVTPNNVRIGVSSKFNFQDGHVSTVELGFKNFFCQRYFGS